MMKKERNYDENFNNLTEAEVDHPCDELGYTEYEKTETHGAMGVTMTLDKYKQP